MRAVRCRFCSTSFAGKEKKHKYCHHIVNKHIEQIPEELHDNKLEFAYSLFVNKPMGRLCLMCRKKSVHFNDETLKYERLCDDPECKTAYIRMMKERMKKVYGKEHLLNEAEMQRKMLYNHPNAQDYVWGEYTFRVIGSYEVDFLNFLRKHDWSPADIICPSPNDYHYKWDDGTWHLYIPDFFIPSLSLEVEIKDGSETPIPGREHNREIELLKDKRMAQICAKSSLNYIKIVGKNYDEFIEKYIKSDGSDV
jgi:hypothetical protein